MAFSKSEFERRHKEVQEELIEQGLDALIATNRETVEYLGAGSGFDNAWYRHFSQSIAFPTIAVIPATDTPTFIVHNTFEDVVRQSIDGVCDIDVYYEKGANREQPYVGMVRNALESSGVDDGTVGIEIGEGTTTDLKLGVPLGKLRAIENQLPETTFVDGGEVLRRVRMAKSDVELEYIRYATEAVNKTFDQIFDELEPGMSETEVVSLANELVSKQGVRPVWTLAETPPTRSLPRSEASLDQGETLFLDIGATYGGYHTDYNRMAVVGGPSEEQIELNRTVSEITNILADFIEPGVTPADVINVCREEYEKRGLGEDLGLASQTKIGHSIGLTLSEAPQLTGYDETPLEPGMVLCIEPAITAEDTFYMQEQIVIVTDHGSEVISTADQRLYEI